MRHEPTGACKAGCLCRLLMNIFLICFNVFNVWINCLRVGEWTWKFFFVVECCTSEHDKLIGCQ